MRTHALVSVQTRTFDDNITSNAVPEPTVSLIVPAHQDGEKLRACLESVHELTPAPDEVIVVIDGDCPMALTTAESFGFGAMTLSNAAGPGAARNAGARQLTGDILVFVDSDVIVPADTIERFKSQFAQEPELAAVIGSYDDTPSEKNFFSQYRNLLHHHVHQTARQDAWTFWGACGAIRREPFEQCGGFDESFDVPCVEDIDLGYRLRKAGFRIRLCKDLQCTHLKRWNLRDMLRTDFFKRAIPWGALTRKFRCLRSDLNMDWTSRLSVLLVFSMLGFLLAALASTVLWTSTPLGESSTLLWTIVGMGIAGIAFLVLNNKFFMLLLRQRGVGCALLAIPWHGFYYLYGSLGFAIGLVFCPGLKEKTAHQLHTINARQQA